MQHPYDVLPVPGSRRRPMAGTRRVAAADPNEAVFVTIVLRPGPDGTAADEGDIDTIREFAADHALDVVATSPAARSVRLGGTVATMNAAFNVELGVYEGSDRRYRGREGSVYVPQALDAIVVAVLGLDNRPQARAHFKVAGHTAGTLPEPGAIIPHAVRGGFAPAEVAAAYGFPTDTTGDGQTVAIIELGGGYDPADLAAYFAEQGVTSPSVVAVPVDGGANTPGGDADGEVALDIQVVGVIAPGANIAVYFAPNTTDGFYDAIAAAVHDGERRPRVISISWGQAEAGWTASQLDAYDLLFQDAVQRGVTVFAAAGDDGSRDGMDDGDAHCDFPACSPSVVACGGTTLVLQTSSEPSEVAWNELDSGDGATGGGFSHHFAQPPYQARAGIKGEGRGVPDVAANADPLTGYLIRIAGKDVVIGGTSAVAPLFAALTALANARGNTSAGAPHDRFYATPDAFRDITEGDNIAYTAAPGWDPVTGLGSPHGEAVATLLASNPT